MSETPNDNPNSFFFIFSFYKFLTPELSSILAGFTMSNRAHDPVNFIYGNTKTSERSHSDIIYPPTDNVNYIGKFSGEMPMLGIDNTSRNTYYTSFTMGEPTTTPEIQANANAEHKEPAFHNSLLPAYLLSEINRTDSESDTFKELVSEKVVSNLKGKYATFAMSLGPKTHFMAASSVKDDLSGIAEPLYVYYVYLKGSHCILVAPSKTSAHLFSYLSQNPKIGPMFRHRLCYLRKKCLVMNPMFMNHAFMEAKEKYKKEGGNILAIAELEHRTYRSLLTIK